MFEVIAVTNRKLCKGDFLTQIENLCKNEKISKIVLREKDLTPDEYKALAAKVLQICSNYGKELILHKFIDAAKKLGHLKIHLSVPDLMAESDKLQDFEFVGTSIHSLGQLNEAERYGVNYVFAGHIFPTDCKKDLPHRGTEFLKTIISNASCDVYAIGGINKTNINEIAACNAAGACIMSLAMMENIDI